MPVGLIAGRHYKRVKEAHSAPGAIAPLSGKGQKGEKKTVVGETGESVGAKNQALI